MPVKKLIQPLIRQPLHKLAVVLLYLFSGCPAMAQDQPATDTIIRFKFTDSTLMKGSRMVCDKLTFEKATTLLTPGAEIYIDSIAAMLKANPQIGLTIQYNHRQWPGKAGYNLPHQRALAIAEYLNSEGVDVNRLKSTSVFRSTDKDIDELNHSLKGKSYFVELILW